MSSYWERHDEILQEEHDSILECLGPDQHRLFTIEKTERGYRFIEDCDGYYGVTLSQRQFERLIEELKALALQKSDAKFSSMRRRAD